MSRKTKQRTVSFIMAFMLVLTTLLTPNGLFGVKKVRAAGHDVETYNVNADPGGPNGFIWENEGRFFSDSWPVGTVFEGTAAVIDSRTTTGVQITEKNFFVTHKGTQYGEFNYATVKCTSGQFSGIILKENNCMNPGWDTPFVGMERSRNGWYNFGNPDHPEYSFGYRATLTAKTGSVKAGDVKFTWRFDFSWSCPQGTGTNMTNGITIPSSASTAGTVRYYPGNHSFAALSHKYGNVCWIKDNGNNRWIPLAVQAVSENLVYGFRDDNEYNVTVRKESSSVKFPFTGINFDIYNGTAKIGNMKVDPATGICDKESYITGLANGYSVKKDGNGIYYISWKTAGTSQTVKAVENLGGNTSYKKGPDVSKTLTNTSHSAIYETLKQTNDVISRYVYVIKTSADPDVSDGNSSYDLAGAQFGVFLTEDDARNRTGMIAELTTVRQTDGMYATGKADLSAYFAAGAKTFYIKELKAPKGFNITNEIKTVSFTDADTESQMTKSVTFTDAPAGDPVLIDIVKESDEGNVPYSLEGAVFEIAYYDMVKQSIDELSGEPKKKWYVRTIKTDMGFYEARLQDEKSFISEAFTVNGTSYKSDVRYTDSYGNVIVPIGSVTIREISAAEGYIKDSGKMTITETGEEIPGRIAFFTIEKDDSEGGAAIGINVTNKSITITNSPKRGDLSFTKSDTDNKKLADITFNLSLFDETGKKKVETHQIKTDADGNFDSKKSNVYFYGTSDKSKWDPSGIDVSKGHLVLGTYMLEEVKTGANEGYQLIEPKTFKVTEDGQVVNQGTLIDTPNPSIKTLEWDKDNSGDAEKTHISMADSEVTVVDTVTYTNLIAGKNYTVKGILVDIKGTPVKDKDGNYVAAYTNFTAKNAANRQQSCGTVDVTFTFNAEKLAGTKFVVFEYLYDGTETTNVTVNDNVIDESKVAKDNDGVLIKHTDTSDKNQIGFFPSLSTDAADKVSGEKQVPAGTTVTVRDTVRYTNFIAGESFTVSGQIMDAATGKAPVVNGKVKTIRESKTFKPDKAEGDVYVDFTFDSTGMEGMTLVVYETVRFDKYGQTVVQHHNRNDKRQQVYIPEIGTKAKDKSTEDSIALGDTTITLIDTVSYKNLVPGKTYTIKGILMDKETGKAFIDADGKEVYGEAELVAPEAEKGGTTVSGEKDVEFTFNAKGMKSIVTVVFEDLYLGDVKVAAHAEIEDEGQTITIPGGKTKASDGKTGTHTGKPEKTAKIIDIVSYTKLLPEKEYVVKGTLMDKSTGEPLLVDGREVTAESPFKTGAAADGEFTVDGEVEMVFEFDASALEGKTIVVFENISYNGKDVFVHADLEDEEQTIMYPKISTMAGIDNGRKKAEEAKNLVIRDMVEYDNLTPGEKYTIKGVLMDPKTGSPLLINGKSVTAEAEFIPESKNGSVEISFTFDGTDLLEPGQSMKVVVYETLYAENGEELAKHTEIDDEKQTVEIYKPKKPPKTGDGFNMMLIIVIGAAAALILVAALKRRKDS
ncbi:MAG: VaFE repeat-containing surface-anchored protein [Lachnospiraceae bacterium]|nr:VaFE repeat-containing surface-anchored protein [Lachnospiraceae bacterium]